VFIEAIERKDPRMKNVYFDVCGIAIPSMWEDKAGLIVKRIRQIGTKRVLYGSDAATPAAMASIATDTTRVPSDRKQRCPYIANWISSGGAY
jgi:predicted TIM-barrel fold metal-dependent hydrolase